MDVVEAIAAFSQPELLVTDSKQVGTHGLVEQRLRQINDDLNEVQQERAQIRATQ